MSMNNYQIMSVFVVVFLVALVAMVSAKVTCDPPEQWEGFMYYGNTDMSNVGPTFQYEMAYDAVNERTATTVTSMGSDILPPSRQISLYKEHVEYTEQLAMNTCQRSVLNDSFVGSSYFGVLPSNARFAAALYIGAESYSPGLRVDMWKYDIDGSEFTTTVTHKDCIPVSTQRGGKPTVSERFYSMQTSAHPGSFVPGQECPKH